MRSPLRNRVGWRERLARWQGSTVRFDLNHYDDPLAEIDELAREARDLSDRALETRFGELRGKGRSREVRASVYALVCEASRRGLGQTPFDVQVVAALALDDGAVVEMQTGEGKTLAAVMPAALNALTGRGAHILTFNDYLARRDAEWMGSLYRMLGLSVGYVQQGMTPRARREAYRADVTYVTAKEAGFDHLRDLLSFDPRDQVHRPFHFALVDEADSLMIDEARVPLVIAGSAGREASSAPPLAALAASLTPGVDFDTDEYGRDVELTEAGIEQVERVLGCGALHGIDNEALLTEINCALHARVLLRRDVDYIVRGGRVELVDELTGRVVEDRHWPDGLQAALEAKEGVVPRADGRILRTLTLQCFLRGYERLCGMTGTARKAASELQELYELEVVVVPTHRPNVRVDAPDVVFTHREAKELALLAEVRRATASGRPVLVGTLTVEESERLALLFRSAGISCEVLNARNDASEARIVARAGALGAVTISTNMAGRGTDIRLGGENETDHDAVAALGGLYVIGTNRHESRRVDQQLRGRAGRQGDPGESRFFLSLEDDLLVRYGIRRLIPERFLPAKTDAPIAHPVVRREIARAQRIIEGQNLEIRRTLSRYSAVVEEQQSSLMERRQALVVGLAAPDVWKRSPERRAALVAVRGEESVSCAERATTLLQIDEAWRDHLSLCADLREGIHLVRLGGQDPLERFTREVMQAFSRIEEEIDESVLAALENPELALDELVATKPSSTWTYLVNDDPFRNQIGMMLTGPGSASLAIYSAVVLMPLLIAWGLVDRLLKKRLARRAGPFAG